MLFFTALHCNGYYNDGKPKVFHFNFLPFLMSLAVAGATRVLDVSSGSARDLAFFGDVVFFFLSVTRATAAFDVSSGWS